MNDRIYYLYRITNLITNKLYIGQTVQPHVRWCQHRDAAAKDHPVQAISCSIKKHGNENFIFEIIAICKTEDDANLTEIELITQYQSLWPLGYNVDGGGDVTRPRHLTEAHKAKLRKPKSHTENMGREIGSIPWNKGKIFSNNKSAEYMRKHRSKIEDT